MAEEVKLFKTWSTPYGFRVLWALNLKGIQYDFVDEDLSDKSPLLLQYNPVHKKVPVLIHNGKPVAESLVILEYIEDTWKHNPLLPEDPYLRSQARFLVKFGDDMVLPSLRESFLNKGKEREEALETFHSNLGILEAELIRKGNRFFAGEEIGLVDVAFGWLVIFVPVVEEIGEFKLIDGQQFPALCSWVKEFSGAPAIRENLPPHEKMVAKYRAIREAMGQ